MANLKRREEARRLAEERNLAGVANNTKWTEFFSEVSRLTIPLKVKLLYEPEAAPGTQVWLPAKNYLDSKYGPNLFLFIEWVKSSAVTEIKHAAETAGLQFSVTNNEITVYGYR